MIWEALFFYGFGLVAIVTALLMILSKNPVVSAVYLVITFFCLAGFFVMLNANLLAALQVLVYAGAIMVLFLFVIMLLNLNRTSFTSYKLFFTKLLAVGVVAVICFMLVTAYMDSQPATATPLSEGKYKLGPDTENPIETIGMVLFTRYIYPFEIMAIMLLAAVIGAVIITKKRA